MEEILDFDGVKEERIDTATDTVLQGDAIVEEMVFGNQNISKNAKESKGFLQQAIGYMERNWIFLVVVGIIWILTGTDEKWLPKIPIIGGLLMYLSAAWNGPAFNFLDPYTFMVGATAKATYLLAMTGVVFPSIKELLTEKNPLSPYTEAFSKLKGVVGEAIKRKALSGLLVASGGLAMIIANFLSRNGKVDKSFVIILLAFMCFKNLSGKVNSALNIILTKIVGLFAIMLPGGLKNLTALNFAFVGLLAGFLAEVLIGNIGESVGYMVGAVLVVLGFVFMLIKKEKA
jgi:hypothetical protein